MPKAFTLVTQPCGLSHCIQFHPSTVSPTARIAYPAPSTAPAIAVAVRAFSASCAVTAATPANTHPQPANAAPKATEPVTGAP